jgi:hypothetical protein
LENEMLARVKGLQKAAADSSNEPNANTFVNALQMGAALRRSEIVYQRALELCAGGQLALALLPF